MTEVERIIKEGIIRKDFLKSETICDFFVDEKRKKIWAIEIDLLLQIDRVCKKYGLRYFLMWGSLLGAIRHEGFIPWDDDLDIALPRKDYEELLKHAHEFSNQYFLQTPETDSGFYYSHAKLRNSNTTALDYPFLFQGFNMGIFIDILPLDYFDETEGERIFEDNKKLISEVNVAMRLTHPYLNARDKERVAAYHGGNPLETLSKMNSNSLACKHSSKVSFLGVSTYGLKRNLWNAADFEEIKECNFNGITTRIPCNYDHILTVAYGDYMRMPSKEERGTWHSNVVFIPDVPYKESLARWEQLYDKAHPNTHMMSGD